MAPAKPHNLPAATSSEQETTGADARTARKAKSNPGVEELADPWCAPYVLHDHPRHHPGNFGLRDMFISPVGLVMGLAAFLILAGCSGNVGRAGLAEGQIPSCGSPAMQWRDVSARLTMDTPTRRISCRAILHRNAECSIRLVLLADEGPLLLDIERNGSGIHLHQSVEGLHDSAASIGEIVWQVWGNEQSCPGSWEDGVWVVDGDTTRRVFGGDPLLLRRIERQQPSVDVGDYRIWEGSLLAYQARASGPGFSVTVILDRPIPTRAQAPGLR